VAAEGAGPTINPIEQFHIHPLGAGVKLFGTDISFTNSSLFMVIAVAVVCLITIYGSSRRSIVPGRLQNLAELSYEFVANTLTGVTGPEGMRFFPFVFSLFMFVLTCNFIGLIPYAFTVTSHVIVTAAFALLVMAVVLIAGFVNHGTHFLRLFVPSGVPIGFLPFMVVIEVVSFLLRPISLSLRLFGNMLAGHIALKVFGGFVVALLASGVAGILSPLPFFLAVALTALEFLVAFLQAYVFAILCCVYLNDALHPGH
jgi:F-type H+-transporting ATPase subunit a